MTPKEPFKSIWDATPFIGCIVRIQLVEQPDIVAYLQGVKVSMVGDKICDHFVIVKGLSWEVWKCYPV